ncbi:MAG: coenzyme F420 hydrogenase [Planctomycetota bacterium]|nr:MAG: coenzyme F420 hydrogenase [Planctomycetota bacterium]
MNNIRDVVERQLCCGCGVCAYLSPDSLEMVDAVEHGRRPRHRGGSADDPDAMKACPGIMLERADEDAPAGVIPELLPGWGPVLEVWEGHATDEAIRFAGSSGGAASALALACIEDGGMHGVLHVRSRSDAPILNETVLSTTREEILRATGSRYAPASPCDGLQAVEDAAGPCVFIGKPCDVAAVRNATRLRAPLREKVGVTIAFFCAGTPTTRGTMALLDRLGIDDPSDVLDVRYRGNGWPGRTVFTVKTATGTETRSLSYEESWGEILTNHKQWRCNVCADHTGEFADIAVGDPWHRRPAPREPGRSLILVRTERGRRILADAVAAGRLAVERSEPSVLPAAQPELLRGRGAVWGRLLACRLMGVPAPRYRGMPMFRHWWSRLTVREKAGATIGTIRRVNKRGLRARTTVS